MANRLPFRVRRHADQGFFVQISHFEGPPEYSWLTDDDHSLRIVDCSWPPCLDKIPSTVKRVSVASSDGLIDLTGLPEELSSLTLIECNQLESLDSLPANLEALTIVNCGRLQWHPELLPRGLRVLWLEDMNEIEAIGSIPRSVQTLSLEKLGSVTDLDGLPEGLQKLYLRELPEVRDLRALPENIVTLLVIGCPRVEALPFRPSIQQLILSREQGYRVYTPDGESIIEGDADGRMIRTGAGYLDLVAEVMIYMANRKKRPSTASERR